jgi:hypothetical protein
MQLAAGFFNYQILLIFLQDGWNLKTGHARVGRLDFDPGAI